MFVVGVRANVTFQVCFTCRDGSVPKASEQASNKSIKVTERSPFFVAVALIYMHYSRALPTDKKNALGL